MRIACANTFWSEHISILHKNARTRSCSGSCPANVSISVYLRRFPPLFPFSRRFFSVVEWKSCQPNDKSPLLLAIRRNSQIYLWSLRLVNSTFGIHFIFGGAACSAKMLFNLIALTADGPTFQLKTLRCWPNRMNLKYERERERRETWGRKKAQKCSDRAVERMVKTKIAIKRAHTHTFTSSTRCARSRNGNNAKGGNFNAWTERT